MGANHKNTSFAWKQTCQVYNFCSTNSTLECAVRDKRNSPQGPNFHLVVVSRFWLWFISLDFLEDCVFWKTSVVFRKSRKKWATTTWAAPRMWPVFLLLLSSQYYILRQESKSHQFRGSSHEMLLIHAINQRLRKSWIRLTSLQANTFPIKVWQ